MAFYHGNTYSEWVKTEQIITELFAKSLHIILESRCPDVSSRNYSGEQALFSPSPSSSSSSSSSSFKPRDKWFNLALRDCPAALENIDFWRQSNLEPMVVDVILGERRNDWDLLNFSRKGMFNQDLSRKDVYHSVSDNDEFGCEMKNEKIIERWVLKYESKKSGGNGSGSGNKRSSCTGSQSLYNKSMVLLRSLYATVRLLPAYKLFRDLISSAQIRLYNLFHRVSSNVEQFVRREEADMQQLVFSPIDTIYGRLCLSVSYRSILDVSSEPSTPIPPPQFIPEYVGSPLAEPLKRLPSVPLSQYAMSSSPFSRRHSWGYDLYRASAPSVNASPSPTHSESNASWSNHLLLRRPPSGLPRPLQDESPLSHGKTSSYDEYWPFPAFSPSPSASSPTYPIPRVLPRTESDPDSIPASRLSSRPSHPNNQSIVPFHMNTTRQTVSKLVVHSGLDQSISTADKDDYDDSEFSGAFILDDDEMIDPGSRPGSLDHPGDPFRPHEPGAILPIKESHDSAVGALVQMLRKAPPLGRDISITTPYLQGSEVQVLSRCMQDTVEVSEEPMVQHSSSSSLTSTTRPPPASKTAADALKELHVYTEIKEDLLLKQGKNSQ